MNIEKVRKHRNIKLVSTEKRRDYLVSEPNYHTIKFFTGHLLAMEMKKKQKKKTEIITYKPVYLGFSKLELSKILKYEFWYDCVKCKYGEEAQMFI